jgi:hypothetical protein
MIILDIKINLIVLNNYRLNIIILLVYIIIFYLNINMVLKYILIIVILNFFIFVKTHIDKILCGFVDFFYLLVNYNSIFIEIL